MADENCQRGGASLTLLFASLFVTSFGVSGQLAYSLAPGMQPVARRSSDIAVQIAVSRLPKGSVLAEQTTTMNLVEAIASPAAAFDDEFLSEVTEPPSVSATLKSATPSATPKPKVVTPTRLPVSPRRTTAPTRSPKSSPSVKPLVQKSSPAKSAQPTPAVSASPSARIAGAATTTSPVAKVSSLNAEKIFTMVNSHRANIGKAAFIKEDSLCRIAENRAPQIKDELYGGKKMHSGFYGLNLPYWATENIAAYSTEEQTVKWWLSDYIHKKAIESDNKYSCVACSGRYCSQVFTSFIKK